MPSQFQAGVYSAVVHYLKTIAAAKSDDAMIVVPTMKELSDRRCRLRRG